jgi:predicted RNase H-like HicB family nuclease
MKSINKYLRYNYPIRIYRCTDGMYCAEIEEIDGLCAYGRLPQIAMKELESVKETAFELMLEQGKEPPAPKIHLEIPEDVFARFSNKAKLREFMKV